MRLTPMLEGALSQEMNNRTIRRPRTRRERGRGRPGGSLAYAALGIALLSLLEVTPVTGAFLPFPMKLAFNLPSNPGVLRLIEDQIERSPLLMRSRRNENIPQDLKSFFDMISNGGDIFEEEDPISASSEPQTDSDPGTESEFNQAHEAPVQGPNLYSNPYAFPNPQILFHPRSYFDPDSYPYADPPLDSELYPSPYPYPDFNSHLGTEPYSDQYSYRDTDSPLEAEPYPGPDPYPGTDYPPLEPGSIIESHYQEDPDCTMDPIEVSDVIPEADAHVASDSHPLESVFRESSAMDPSMAPHLSAIPSPSPTPESDSMSDQNSPSTFDKSPDSFPYSTPATATKCKRPPPPVDPKSIVVDEHVEELEEDLLGPVLDIFAGPRLPSKNRATIFDLANTVLKAVESNKEEDVNRAKMKPEEKAEMFLPRKSGSSSSPQIEDTSPPNPKLLDITKAFLRMVKTDKRYEVREARKRDALRRAQEEIEREHAEREELMEQEKTAEQEKAEEAAAEQTGQNMQTEQIDNELEVADTSTQVAE